MARALLVKDRAIAVNNRAVVVFDPETGAGAECCCEGEPPEPCDDSSCCTECGASFCTHWQYITNALTDPRVTRSWHGRNVTVAMSGTLSRTRTSYHPTTGAILSRYTNTITSSISGTWNIPNLSLCDFRGTSVTGTVQSVGSWSGSLVTPSSWNYNNPEQWFFSNGVFRWWSRGSSSDIRKFPNSWTVFDTGFSYPGVASIMFDQAKSKDSTGTMIDSFDFTKFMIAQISPTNVGFEYGAYPNFALANCSGNQTIHDVSDGTTHTSAWSTSAGRNGGSFSATYDFLDDNNGSGTTFEDSHASMSGSWTITRIACSPASSDEFF